MTNLLEFPKIMCYHQSKSMYCETKHETNNCFVNFTFETKKLNAKNLLLRLDFGENQIRCNIMKFVYRCDEVSIWMGVINVRNNKSQKYVKKQRLLFFININILKEINLSCFCYVTLL